MAHHHALEHVGWVLMVASIAVACLMAWKAIEKQDLKFGVMALVIGLFALALHFVIAGVQAQSNPSRALSAEEIAGASKQLQPANPGDAKSAMQGVADTQQRLVDTPAGSGPMPALPATAPSSPQAPALAPPSEAPSAPASTAPSQAAPAEPWHAAPDATPDADRREAMERVAAAERELNEPRAFKILDIVFWSIFAVYVGCGGWAVRRGTMKWASGKFSAFVAGACVLLVLYVASDRLMDTAADADTASAAPLYGPPQPQSP